MSESSRHHQLRLDPWAASSLLQKAIRRGEATLAQQATTLLHRSRGAAVWRRLITIAVEDVGIGDLNLVCEIIHLANNKEVRALLAPERDLLTDICSRLAAAPKDRSADYLMSMATMAPSALHNREEMLHLKTGELMAIAANAALPLPQRAIATLLTCTDTAQPCRLRRERVENLLARMGAPDALQSAFAALAFKPTEPFVLMLPLLWSQWQWAGGASRVVMDEPPEPEFVGSIPLYVYDKHTAVGKRAIALFAQTNPAVRETLARHVSSIQRIAVAEIAAFYADAAPVKLRLEWAEGHHLRLGGLRADMTGVGCSPDGVAEVVKAVQEKLPDMNAARRRFLASHLHHD
jgi:hypothetical protein